MPAVLDMLLKLWHIKNRSSRKNSPKYVQPGQDSGMLGGDDRMSSALSRVILPEKMMYRVPTEKSRVVWKTSRHEPLREAYGGCQRIERS